MPTIKTMDQEAKSRTRITESNEAKFKIKSEETKHEDITVDLQDTRSGIKIK